MFNWRTPLHTNSGPSLPPRARWLVISAPSWIVAAPGRRPGCGFLLLPESGVEIRKQNE